jgi:tetratricopeptide (TPR) repeat protein
LLIFNPQIEFNAHILQKRLFLRLQKKHKGKMANKDNSPMTVSERWERIENYFEDNKKVTTIVAAIIAVVVGGFVTFKYWYIPSQENDAEMAMRRAQNYFAADSANKAIKGDGSNLGFQDIADQYSWTPAGKLANYYLGLCYYQTGKYQDAIDNLEKFNAHDVLVSANAAGVEGDAEMQLNNTDKAIDYYMEAVKRSDNDYTAPMFMKKAAQAYELKGDYTNALNLYQSIKSKYFNYSEANDIDKYIARAQVKAGK